MAFTVTKELRKVFIYLIISEVFIGYTLLKIKVLYDAIEEPFCLNGSTKNISVSQKVLCGEKKGSSDYKKVSKRWFFKEPLTEWFFVEPKRALLWHRCEETFEAPLFLRMYE